MNFNVDFNANTFKNEMLRTVGGYVSGQAEGDRPKHLTQLTANGRLRLIEGGVQQTGKNGWRGRTEEDKNLNNSMRDAFVKALSNELGLKGSQEELLNRLETLFGRDVFKKGDYGKGRPLTMRRITAVLNKVDDVKTHLTNTRVSDAMDRLTDDLVPEARELLDAAVAAMPKAIGKGIKQAVGSFLDRAALGSATTLDLEAVCFKLLSAARKDVGVTTAEVKKLAGVVRGAFGKNAGRFDELLQQIKADATLCLEGRARFTGANFAQRYTHAVVDPLVARYMPLLDGDAKACRMYALIGLDIEAEITARQISAEEQLQYTCNRLREFGVSDEMAKKLWNIDNLNARETQDVQGSRASAVKVLKQIDEELMPLLAQILDVPEDDGALAQFIGKTKAECPKFGAALADYEAKIKALAAELSNVGQTLLQRVETAHPKLTMAQKLVAVAQMMQDVKERIAKKVVKGEADFTQVIRDVPVPSADKMQNPSVKDQLAAFKALLVKYAADYSKNLGNANNQNGFYSRMRNMLEAIKGTLAKVEPMLAVRSEVLAKLEEAKIRVNGDYRKPCNKTTPGKEAVRLIEIAMGGAGAHGDINGVGEMAFAVEMFCKIPELLCQALEIDQKNGNDAGFRALCNALNTDGCVQAYAESIAIVYDKFNGFENGVDLGAKNDPKMTIDILIGRAFPTVFKGVDTDHPISFDDFAERFARYLADRDRGSYEERLAEIRARKEDGTLAFLADIGVEDRPIVSTTTLFNTIFFQSDKVHGEVVKENGESLWKGLAFRADARPFSEVREDGRSAKQSVDGFSSRKDLSDPENLKEAKGEGAELGFTGQSGVSCCQTVSKCICYAMPEPRRDGCYIYIIDTTKAGATEKTWDIDSAYEARGGTNVNKAGAEVNASSVRKEAVMGWIKVPTHIAGIDKGENGMSVEENKLAKLKLYAEAHPEAIEINPDFAA